MVIYIEDYLARRLQARAQAETLRLAVGGGAAAIPGEPAPARWPAPAHAAVLLAGPGPELPEAPELADLFAEATLI